MREVCALPLVHSSFSAVLMTLMLCSLHAVADLVVVNGGGGGGVDWPHTRHSGRLLQHMDQTPGFDVSNAIVRLIVIAAIDRHCCHAASS